ncbi:MAG TPA: TonB-dependent receptor, partial [Caldithrix sp.]|nr:TonB-dependent receptor [Caldithrix sp.]
NRNEPITNITVQVDPGNYTDITDHNGYFIVDNIPEGNYQIKLQHVAYQTKLIKHVTVTKMRLTSLDTIRLTQKILLSEEFIITADRIEKDPFESSSAINVISQSEITERAAKTSAEALREENGLFVQKTNHGGGSAIIRGLSSNQILILVDGIRLNNSLYRLGNHQYLTTVDNNNIEQIEIVRGPTSTLYGSDAMGGTINLRTRVPEFSSSDFESNFSLLSRYASADDEKTISLRSGLGIDKFSFSAGFSYKDYDDMRRGRNSDYKRIENSTDGIMQSPNAYTAYDFDSKLTYKITEQSSLIAAYQLANQDKVPRYDKYENDDYYVWQYHPQKRQLGYLKYQQSFNSHYIHSFNTTVSFNKQIEGRQTQRHMNSDLQKEKDEAQTLGLTFEAKSILRKHVFIYGTEIYLDKVQSEHFDYDAISGVRTKSTTSRYPDGAKYNSYGFYLQDEYTLFKNLTTTLGGRFSYFDTQFKLIGMDSTLFSNNNSYDQSFSSLTFSLGAVYRMTDYFHINLNFGQAFRAPNLSDISKFGESKGNIFEVPNPDLEPEKMSTIDLGIKINQSSLKIDGSLYYSNIFNLLASADAAFNGSPIILIDSTEFKVKSKQNIGNAYIYGIEGAFRYIYS